MNKVMNDGVRYKESELIRMIQIRQFPDDIQSHR